MKCVEAIVRPFKLDEIKDGLSALGVGGMTVIEVQGFDWVSGTTEVYRSSSYQVDFIPRVRIEVVVADELVAPVLDAIERTAKTGHAGDGKIFVSDVVEVVRIRTGERGQSAL